MRPSRTTIQAPPSSAPPNGRVETFTRPAWRVALSARWPRIVAGLVAAVVMVAGVRAIVAGAPAPPPVPPAPPVADSGAQAFAEGFVRAYLAWDPRDPEGRDARLAAYAASELDAGAGLEPSERLQTVAWTAIVGSQATGRGRQVVTVAARAGGRDWHLAVPVTRDKKGFLVVAAYPALVGPPPVAGDQALVEEDDVEDAQLVRVAERAVKNYLAGAPENLAADLDPKAVVSLPATEARVELIDAVTRAPQGRVAVAVTAVVAGARMSLRYELEVVKRERWYVRSIAADPRARPAGAPR